MKMTDVKQEQLVIFTSLTQREFMLVEALQAAQSHLEYIGYGDAWERES
jgi:hypothetical protein